MKFSAGCLQCRAQQRRPAATNFPPQHEMFSERLSSSGTRLASKTNAQMTSGAKAARLYYKDFAGASQPLPKSA